MKALLLFALALGLAGCATVQIDETATRTAVAQQLAAPATEIVFLRPVNYAVIPDYAKRPAIGGKRPANFFSGIYVQTKTQVAIFRQRNGVLFKDYDFKLADIRQVAVEAWTTTLTRDKLQQIQIDAGTTLVALNCTNSTDRTGGDPADTEIAYEHLRSAGLVAGSAHGMVFQGVPIPMQVYIK